VEPIICEICYEFFGSPAGYLSHQKAEHGEEVKVYTGCFECDFEAEFQGRVDERDIAHFPCPNCGQEFQITDFSLFFDEDEEVEE